MQTALARQTQDGAEIKKVPFLIKAFLDASDAVRRFKAKRGGASDYKYLFLAENGHDLEELKGYIEEGKLKPVVGARVDVKDIEKLKEACTQTFKGKGPVGKTVVEIIKDE